MKFIISILFSLICQILSAQIPNATGQPSMDRNYVLTRVFRTAGVTAANLNSTRNVAQENWTIGYQDGFGRPVLNIQLMGSPGFRDIIQYLEYDSAGREITKFLPYADQSAVKGGFRSTAKAVQLSYYNPANTWDTHVKKTVFPYSRTIVEDSPMGRILQQGAPGEAWQPALTRTAASGRTAVSAYGSNTASGADALKLWRVTATGAVSSANYAADRLYRTTTKDENWTSGRTGTIDTYSDAAGTLLLSRTWKNETEALDTYYIYDVFGRLRYLVPPGVTVASFSESDAVFLDRVYAYRYDGRGRTTEKKVPGKGWQYFVYNRADQLVLSQDAEQRVRKEWSYVRYDNLGRSVSTGLYTNTAQTTLAQLRTLVDNFTGPLWEQRRGTAAYANTSFPVAAAGITIKPLSVSYYDDYAFSGAAGLPAQGITQSPLVATLLTGQLLYKDDGTLPLLSVCYYDDRGRTLQVAAQNHLGGTDYLTSTYSFSGELLSSRHEHKAAAAGPLTTVVTSYGYDHAGRLTDTRKKVNTQAEIIQTRLQYNEIGQLARKLLHSENGGTNFIATIDLSYNERGWTTKIGSPYFTEVLNYNEGTLGTTQKQYNGNISEQLWGHGTTATPNRFVYSYDALGRLTKGASTGTVMAEELSYDNMGNILSLKRDNGPVINYGYSGSRLSALSGGMTAAFSYDANGNATTDRTGMAFTYNVLGLPATAVKGSTSVNYLYDAAGTKLRRTATVSGTTTQRDYAGGLEYSKTGSAGSLLELIPTEEGYLQNSSGTFSYYYNLKDHLGNVRATLQRTSATAGTVVQKDDYYPFGKRRPIVTSGLNSYLYNGKEMQAHLGGGTHALGSSYIQEGQYDYGARFYDAEIGRWNTIDPLAEQMAAHSQYNYGFNNPVNFIDPDGRMPFREFPDSYRGILGPGDWRTSDRLSGNAVWDAANEYNIRNGIQNQYEPYEQVRDFYMWVNRRAAMLGHDVKWMRGAIGLVSSMAENLQPGTISEGFIDPNLSKLLQDLNIGIQNGTLSAFKDLLYGKYSRSPLKGKAAEKWDIDLVNFEQGTIAPRIYNSASSKAVQYMQDLVDGDATSWHGFLNKMGGVLDGPSAPPFTWFNAKVTDTQARIDIPLLMLYPSSYKPKWTGFQDKLNASGTLNGRWREFFKVFKVK